MDEEFNILNYVNEEYSENDDYTEDEQSDDEAINVNDLELSARSRKKQESGRSYYQEEINKSLLITVPINAFIPVKIDLLIVNTKGITCRKCGSDQINVYEVQLRGGDEAMTKFYTCLNCGNKWREG